MTDDIPIGSVNTQTVFLDTIQDFSRNFHTTVYAEEVQFGNGVTMTAADGQIKIEPAETQNE